MATSPVNDAPDGSISDFQGAQVEAPVLSGLLPDWPEILIYGGCALTGLDVDTRQRLSGQFDVIEDVLGGHFRYDRKVSLSRPAREMDPVEREDVLPYEVYAKNLRLAATSAAMFVFVDPPAHGVGQEILMGTGCGTPIVLFQMVDPSQKACFSPPYFERVTANENPEYLRAVSRMVRGISLCPPPGLVRFYHRHDLERHFRAYWSEYGGPILESGLVSLIHRHRVWKKASENLLKRRRIVGLNRKQLASAAGCHFSLIENMECEPLVFSALSLANIERVLAPLGYWFEDREPIGDSEELGALTFGSPPHIDLPLGKTNYKHFMKSHKAYIEFRRQRKPETAGGSTDSEQQWDELWFEARGRTSLPVMIFKGGSWQHLQTDESRAQATEASLFSIEVAPTARSYRRAQDMPQSTSDWRHLWEVFKNEQGWLQ